MQITQKKVSHLTQTARKEALNIRISNALQETMFLLGKTNFHGGDRSVRKKVYTAWATKLRIARNSLSGASEEQLAEAEQSVMRVEKLLSTHKASTDRAINAYIHGEAQLALEQLRAQTPLPGKNEEYENAIACLERGSAGSVLNLLETLNKNGIGSLAFAPAPKPMLDGEPNEMAQNIRFNIDTLRENTQDARVHLAEIGEKKANAKWNDGVLIKLGERLNVLKTSLGTADTDGMIKIAEEAANYGTLLKLVTRDEFQRQHGLEGIVDVLNKNGVKIHQPSD